MGLRRQGLHQVGMLGCVTRSRPNFQTPDCTIPRPGPGVGRGGMFLTTNRRIRDRTEPLVGDEAPAAAILDRLPHRSRVLNITGRSYRLRDLEDTLKRQARLARHSTTQRIRIRLLCDGVTRVSVFRSVCAI